jgi:DNA-directed RNA polymerase subunit RPC12/RpoP
VKRKRVTVLSRAKDSRSARDKLAIVRTLIELNSLEVHVNKGSSKEASRRAVLRRKLSTQILMAHDGLVALGRCSLAPRILGKCAECSAKAPPAISPRRAVAGALIPCPRCGTLLYG